MDVEVPHSSLRGTARAETTPLLESGPGFIVMRQSPKAMFKGHQPSPNHKHPQTITNYCHHGHRMLIFRGQGHLIKVGGQVAIDCVEVQN